MDKYANLGKSGWGDCKGSLYQKSYPFPQQLSQRTEHPASSMRSTAQNLKAQILGHDSVSQRSTSYDSVKRACDLLICFICLPVVAVLVCIVSVLVLICDGRPIFLVQPRTGRGGRRFPLFKFRTMVRNARELREQLLHLNELTLPDFKISDDPRITKLGRILRKTSLDELPQIINVLRGEMSLIGPRPDAFDHACAYMQKVPGYYSRHSVMPGISGLAQVEVGYVDGLEGLHRKVAADLHYIRHATAWMDLWIVWRTLAVVVARRGS